jgi:hypothetical protein
MVDAGPDFDVPTIIALSTPPDTVFSVPGHGGDNLLVALVLDVPEPDLAPVENLLTPTMLDVLAGRGRRRPAVQLGDRSHRPRDRSPWRAGVRPRLAAASDWRRGVVLGGGRAARPHRRRRALHGDGADDAGAAAQCDRCLRRPRHERARSAVPGRFAFGGEANAFRHGRLDPIGPRLSVSSGSSRSRLDRRLGLAAAGVDDPPADVDCQRSAKGGLWARRRLGPRGRSEGRFAPRLPHGFGRRRQEVGFLRAALRMPARGPRRSVCAMSVIMHRA